MFCPKCGVRISETSDKCPLCLTALPRLEEERPPRFFPAEPLPKGEAHRGGILFLLTLFFVLGGVLPLILDLLDGDGIGYSFYVIAPLFVLYAAFLLPRWWRRPNPVIFLPIAFLSVMLSVLWLESRVQGGWFWSFIFPLSAAFFLFLEAAVVLLYYLKKGRLYIFGGLFLALGILSFVGEILYRATFSLPILLTYSILPLVFFSVLGMGLIVIAIVPPFRRSFEKRFFV
ncbi:MAG: hypothetical protein IKC69_03990 [Clostridia bacterium]|nr:hypothetical protein [Clostridia bacterium]